ncbi:uncharacterized protein LOC108664581 isoform X4 [Hyalella azteca]|uniref:Uncharacterized protein LOC108664581 isoform X3 n=1 Tax=Hyalella azteca TaxID=294128 RepID=A0A979FT80_HYAAZ|nr:uncharacterized protein LOC108664581 isoform X3 [Hyalella azteca]XP_047740390.1 uncharacterized protein LOC108664581 isoform X4 [Hyalella azteca]
MGPWVVCACCSSGRGRKHQYRYQVVYRREESLYSGPDYLESLPGGRTQQPIPTVLERPSLAEGRQRELLPLPPASKPLGNQSRSNHDILANIQPGRNPNHLHNPSQHLPQFSHPPFVSRFQKESRFAPRETSSNWRSVGHLQEAPSVRFVPPPLSQSKSVPLLALQDASIGSRDQSRDTSRDQSLVSSNATSTRGLLPSTNRFLLPSGPRTKPPPLQLLPSHQYQQFSSKGTGEPTRVVPAPSLSDPLLYNLGPRYLGPRSPHTPLSPGPPAYPNPFLRFPGQQILQFPASSGPAGSVTRDLRQYLNTRFPKGGVDHDLQNTIRDNVYLRTVPVTTRTPRPGELNGLDYTFLSQHEFHALKRSGNLLESGVFQGSLYGTPLTTSSTSGHTTYLPLNRPEPSHGPTGSPDVRPDVFKRAKAEEPTNFSTSSSQRNAGSAHFFTLGSRKKKQPPVNQYSNNSNAIPTSGNAKSVSKMLGKQYNKFVSKTKQILTHDKTEEPKNSTASVVPVNFYPEFPDLVETHRDYFLGGAAYHTVKVSSHSEQAGHRVSGNHYGTPKPPSQPLTSDPRNQSGPKTSSSAGILPGAHPSSEGKRRRNRSNVEAMAANMTEPMTWNSPLPNQYSPQSNMPQQQHLPELRDHTGPTHESSYSASNLQFGMNNDVAMPPAMHPPNDLPDVAGPPDGDLGPLPPNWEQAYTDKGEPYFIDHVAGTSSWLDPRLAKVQKQKAEECAEDELPYGWERIDDPQYGTYYIDHVNRLTQYENPVTMAKTHTDPISDSSPQEAPLPQDQTAINNGGIASNGTSNNNNNNNNNTFPRQKKLSPDGGASMPPKPDGDNSNPGRVSQPPSVASKRNSSTWNTMNSTVDGKPAPVFTRNPAELRGEFLSTQLIKSSRGLGFTIVGGDDTKDEFLQIKSVVPNGPAWQDGNLRTGDVLVYVNDTCVLGYTHADVVNIFQNIEPGRSVYLEVCRGYPLPFDPNDPNTEIVTTVAVTAMDSRSAKSMFGESYERSRHNSNESLNTAKSMPDLSNPDRVQQVPRPGSADLLNSENFDTAPDILDFYNSNMAKPEYLTIPIVKGSMGFGFTIADSAYGQKVKKILDRSRCKNLMEGDILVDINSINVKRMSHTEVVQVLKECAQGQEAIVMVERGGADSPSKNRPRKEPLPSPKKALIGPSSAGSVFPTGQYRSKTPTADMYSSQTKEVIPNRPKTPLVDTRNRPKTPNLVGDGRPYADMTRPLAESVDSRVPDPQGPTGHYPGLYSPNHPPPPHHDMPYDPKLTSVSQQMSNVTLDGSSYSYYNNNDVSRSSAGLDYNYPNNGPMPPQNYSYPNNSSFPSESGYHPNSESYEYDMKRSMSKTPIQDPYYSPYPNSSQPQPYNQYYANDATRSLPSNGNSLMLNNANIINNNLGNNGHNTSIDNAGGNGYMPYPKDGFDVPRQDSGYSSQTQLPPAPNPYHAYYNPTDGHGMQAGAPGYGYSNDNGLVRRKESTSFEHEHPAPVSMPRFPDGRYTVGQRGTRGPPNGNAAPVHEFTVTLRRQETGFGFRIVGGTEEGSQVSIGHIVSGGAADQDGTVLTGDEILAVNGESVVGASHHRAVTLMAAAATRGVVTLTLCRRQPPDLHNRSLELSFPYDITVTRREDEGFGFVIISSVTKSGSTIGRIIEGSPAERCGKLHVGDRILAVNGVDIKSLHHGSIVNLIKLSGYSVTLTIGAPRDDSSSSTNSLKADSDVGDDSGEYMSVELMRGPRGFGFSIRGGREFQQMPLFVLRIAEGGPADHDSKLKVGDQLIEINGQSTKGMTHADAIELIKQSNNTVSLLVKRGGKIPQHLGDPLSSGGVVSPVGPPPPHTNIRSTATLPSPSHSPAYPPPPPSHHHPPPPHHNSNNPYPPPSSLHNPSQPPYVYPHNGSVRYQPPSLQSSPAGQYISPMNPNGPLGQSSPRVISSENYWARMPQ